MHKIAKLLLCSMAIKYESVAVPLSPLNKREVGEDTIYSDMVPLWLYKRPSLIEGLTSFHISV